MATLIATSPNLAYIPKDANGVPVPVPDIRLESYSDKMMQLVQESNGETRSFEFYPSGHPKNSEGDLNMWHLHTDIASLVGMCRDQTPGSDWKFLGVNLKALRASVGGPRYVKFPDNNLTNPLFFTFINGEDKYVIDMYKFWEYCHYTAYEFY